MNTATVRSRRSGGSTTPRVTAPEVVRHGVGMLDEFGPILVALSPRGVCALYLLGDEGPGRALDRLRRDAPGAEFIADDAAVVSVVERTLAHVFQGRPCDDVPLDLRGTPFQRRVWEGLRAIPRGQTRTYGELAHEIGLVPGSARPVGSACGTNRVSLLVPCHRVVAAGGSLGGYYWGLDVKRRLLELEQWTD